MVLWFTSRHAISVEFPVSAKNQKQCAFEPRVAASNGRSSALESTLYFGKTYFLRTCFDQYEALALVQIKCWLHKRALRSSPGDMALPVVAFVLPVVAFVLPIVAFVLPVVAFVLGVSFTWLDALL